MEGQGRKDRRDGRIIFALVQRIDDNENLIVVLELRLEKLEELMSHRRKRSGREARPVILVRGVDRSRDGVLKAEDLAKKMCKDMRRGLQGSHVIPEVCVKHQRVVRHMLLDMIDNRRTEVELEEHRYTRMRWS